MPLPTIETPKYTVKVPSTKQEIEYRPFLVKEEKILMMAQESNDAKSVMKATKDILQSCTFNKLDVDKLAIYDIEYLFLQLRMRSVGEVAKLKLKCSKTGEYVKYDLNLEDVQVQYPKKKVDNKVQLTDNVGITLKPIGVEDATDIGSAEDEKQMVWGIAASIETVYDENGVYQLGDFTEKEVTDFVESLNRSQIEKIQDYLENQPTLSHTIKFKGPEGHDNEVTLKGLQSFFT